MVEESCLSFRGEAEAVVRANLEAVAAAKGAEHPHTLGMTMNLAMLLGLQGKEEEAAALYASLLEVQTRVLGRGAGRGEAR